MATLLVYLFISIFSFNLLLEDNLSANKDLSKDSKYALSIVSLDNSEECSANCSGCDFNHPGPCRNDGDGVRCGAIQSPSGQYVECWACEEDDCDDNGDDDDS